MSQLLVGVIATLDIFFRTSRSIQEIRKLDWLARNLFVEDNPEEAFESAERGVLEVFAKIPRGVMAFRKNCRGDQPFFGFYCIFINKFF